MDDAETQTVLTHLTNAKYLVRMALIEIGNDPESPPRPNASANALAMTGIYTDLRARVADIEAGASAATLAAMALRGPPAL